MVIWQKVKNNQKLAAVLKFFNNFANVISDKVMSSSIIDKIEYLVLLVAAFAHQSNVSESQAYRYLNQYGALTLCEKHYGIMHTLSLDENIQTLHDYCQRKGGKL